MKMNIRIYIIAGIFLFASKGIFAQRDSISNPMANNTPITKDSLENLMAELKDILPDEKENSHFEVGLSYLNDNVYLGRNDSIRTPYITPSLGYYFKSGFFIDGNVNYLVSSTANRVDNVIFEGGYTFSAGNYDGEFSASKYFYSSQSTSVKSEVTGSFSYYNGYDFGFIKPTATASLNFGKKTDYTIGVGLEHTFSIADDKIEFTPTATMNASTRNFYSNYFKNRKYKKKKATNTGIASISGVVENPSAFVIMNYELSLPIVYQVKKFTFSFTPVYSIPENPAIINVTTTKTNGTVLQNIQTEKIKNLFYFSFGLVYKFGGKNK